MRIVVLIIALLIVVLLPLYEKGLNSIINGFKSGVSTVMEGLSPKADAAYEIDGEDILDNKTKWRMLIIGYFVFFIFMVFATVSIATLNAKINNISSATEDILDRLSVLETDTDD